MNKRKLEIWEELTFYINKEKRIKKELETNPDNEDWKNELLRTKNIVEDLCNEYVDILAKENNDLSK